MFIETSSTLPDPTPTSRPEDNGFEYQDTDDLLRDVMGLASYPGLHSPLSHIKTTPPALNTKEMQQLASNVQEVTGQVLLTLYAISQSLTHCLTT